MVSTHPQINLEAEVSRLEAELQLYKQLKLSNIERRINELLDQLDDPATPQTKGQRLRERIGIIATTVALTAIAQGRPEIPLIFQQPVKQEQVSADIFSPNLGASLAKPESVKAPSLTKPTTKPQLNFPTKVKQVAERIGADPIDLLTLMSFESAGTLSPSKRGPHVPGQGRAIGLIQFMPNTAKELGTTTEALGTMTAIEQLDYVERYLLKRGFKPGMGLKQLYSTVFAGHPHARGSISDGYHSLDSAVARMNREHRPRAEAILNGSKPSTFADTKAIIATWGERWQQDARTGDTIAGYPISSERGWRIHPVSRQKQFHNGVDLAAPTGTPVYAIADGQVICTNDPNGGGTVASFTSDMFPNLEFELLHLSKCIEKQQIKAGEMIGRIGNTGNSTGPHLHLQINSTITGNSLRVRAGWLQWFMTGRKP